MKNHLFTIVAYDQSHPSARYQYLINKDGKLYKAFSTTNGYINFLNRMNVELEFTQEINSVRRGTSRIYKAYGTLEEITFTHSSEIPHDAKVYLDIHEGCLVEHHYLHTDTGAIIFKPHIYSEVYKPYPKEIRNEHMAYNG